MPAKINLKSKKQKTGSTKLCYLWISLSAMALVLGLKFFPGEQGKARFLHKSLVGSGFIPNFAMKNMRVWDFPGYRFVNRRKVMSIKDSRIIELPKVSDPRGNLSFIEEFRHIPFEIRRVYWIYDVPGGFDRGEHAYKENQELIVALSGSFDVVLDDGREKVVFPLNRSYKGLYVPSGMWRRMTNFSTNSLALVLASTDYDEDDYIMDYQEFKEWRAAYEKRV